MFIMVPSPSFLSDCVHYDAGFAFWQSCEFYLKVIRIHTPFKITLQGNDCNMLLLMQHDNEWVCSFSKYSKYILFKLKQTP